MALKHTCDRGRYICLIGAAVEILFADALLDRREVTPADIIRTHIAFAPFAIPFLPPPWRREEKISP